ncbi:MAG: hypothetical protein CSA75_00590 [Sorangium cellulosum]|nr:MAG: hypothetical protein CSA75_00590 [Sorangium cellulosum]
MWLGPSEGMGVQQLMAALSAQSIDVDVAKDMTAFLETVAEVPQAILLNARVPNATDLCLSVLTHAHFSSVPIIWIVEDLDDLVFAEAFGVGGDDVARVHYVDGIVRRLLALPKLNFDESVPSRGVALLGEADDQRRMVLARLLRNGGFDVSFSSDVTELEERLRSDEPSLVVADVDLPGGGALSAFERWRALGGQAPWIMATPPKKLKDISQAVSSAHGAWVWDSFAPPENVLYAANEAMRGSFSEQRASPRLLFGTTVAFRIAGRERDDYGFLYNISGEGLFVRTLAPFGSGEEAWLEFKPPRTARLVRLEANVVWRKAYGRVSEATVPPGFGARITGGSRNDLRRYRDGYRALAEQIAGIRFSASPSSAP